ncbi:MAG: LiaF-related protein [Polyangiaceae bacterium]
MAVRECRERVVERLSTAFAEDELALDEFDRRADLAHRTDDEEELRALVADLDEAPGTTSLVRVAPTEALAVRAPEAAPTRLRTIFGSVQRRGAWSASKHMEVSAIFGNVELDFGEVELPPGVTYLRVRAIFGNVEITVPPGVAVDCDGRGILGSFESANTRPDGRGRVLRIEGDAIFGSVEVRVGGGESHLALPARLQRR